MAETLLHGDCLKLLPTIQDNSIDLVLADLPYGGMTANKWDIVIPLQPLFEQYQRIIKDHGAVLLFGMGKFGANLVMSAPKQLPYRYEWVWHKTLAVGFLNCHKMPMRAHENIYVFYKHLPTYNPQMRQGFKPYAPKPRNNHNNIYHPVSGNYQPRESKDGSRFPIDIVKFSNDISSSKRTHPTQKPVALLEYFIKTYTNEGMTVLDNTMGSGSTGVAAKQLKRDFIGIELDKEYYEIAKERINKAQMLVS